MDKNCTGDLKDNVTIYFESVVAKTWDALNLFISDLFYNLEYIENQKLEMNKFVVATW